MSEFYGPTDDDESVRTVHRALELGVTFLDTADMYGHGANETLLGRAIAGRRDEVQLATKFGIVRSDDPTARGLRGDPAYVRASCEASLTRLGIDCIDLYYHHRPDPTVPVEDTVAAMAELVTAGKVRHLGLSEVDGHTLRRAHAVHPISAVQSEWSICSRDVEADVVPVMAELGVGFVAYSPLGRGFLTRTTTTLATLTADDARRNQPRFTRANLSRNSAILGRIRDLAAGIGVQPAQLALAWLTGRSAAFGLEVVPIPGTKQTRYLEQNAQAVDLKLPENVIAELDTIAGLTAGTRYRNMDIKAG